VHVRRALLLFAIVLGLAALVASVSQPRRGSERAPSTQAEEARPAPTATPRRDRPDTTTLRFGSDGRKVHPLGAGRPAVVLVHARAAGQVEIPRLGLSATADRHTPARFDVLVRRPGRYEIRFVTARGDRPKPTGVLLVRGREPG
jgi:hypothetical protein